MFSNYDIKKILPRLIVAAIAVNLSFYICAALVDVSNIIGSNVKDLIMGSGATTNSSAGLFSSIATNSGFATITGGALGAAIVGVVLFMTGSIAAVLLAVILILAMLALRNVLITVLIIISPIAFVLWLLPNTQKLFQKWRDNFVRALFVYPAIMAVWGACNLMINIISRGTIDDLGLFGFVMCCLLAIAPAVAILPIMKMGGQAMGALQGLAQKGLSKAGGDALRKADQERAKRARGNVAEGIKNFGANPNSRFANSRVARTVRGIARHNDTIKDREQKRERDARLSRATEAERMLSAANNGDRYAQGWIRRHGGEDQVTAIAAGVSEQESQAEAAAERRLKASPDYQSYNRMMAIARTSTNAQERKMAYKRATELAVPQQRRELLTEAANAFAAARTMPPGGQQEAALRMASDMSDMAFASAAVKADPSLGGGTRAAVSGEIAGTNFTSNNTPASNQAAQQQFNAHSLNRLGDTLSKETAPTIDSRTIAGWQAMFTDRAGTIAALTQQNGGDAAAATATYNQRAQSAINEITAAAQDSETAKKFTPDTLEASQNLINAIILADHTARGGVGAPPTSPDLEALAQNAAARAAMR